MKVKLTTDLYNKLVSLDTEIKDYVKSEKDKCDNKKQREKIVYKQERAIHVLSLLQTIYIKYNQHIAIAQSVIEKECNLTSTHEARFLLNLLEKFGFIQKYGTASALKKIGYRYRIFFDMNAPIMEYTYELKTRKTPYNKIEREDSECIECSFHSYDYISLNFNSEFESVYKSIYESSTDLYKKTIEYTISDVKEGKWNFSCGKNNKRRSSILTNIKKEFRKFITIDRLPTTNIDIINSQPAFFANYLVEYYGENNLPEDVELFTDLCFENKIYEYLADNIESDRKLAKDFWMKAIYGMESIKTIGDECIRYNKAGLQFAEMFPNVIAVVDTIKARFNSYNEFSVWLQRFESKFVNSVSDLMYAQGIKNLTVYDEFIVKKSEVQLAKAIIEAYAFKNNLKIKLKINK